MSLSGIGTFNRLREILMAAPWSSYDLLSSLIVTGIGGYLLLMPDLFTRFAGVYRSMASVADARVWGGLFLSCGLVGLVNTLWCVRPTFGFRLLSRMSVAFCMVSFAANNLVYVPPPLSAVTYSCLAVWSLWGVVRTQASGR